MCPQLFEKVYIYVNQKVTPRWQWADKRVSLAMNPPCNLHAIPQIDINSHPMDFETKSIFMYYFVMELIWGASKISQTLI